VDEAAWARGPQRVPARRAGGRKAGAATPRPATASGRPWAAVASCHQDIPRFVLPL